MSATDGTCATFTHRGFKGQGTGVRVPRCSPLSQETHMPAVNLSPP